MLSDVCCAASALVDSVGVVVGGFRRRRLLAVFAAFAYGPYVDIVLSVRVGLSVCVGLMLVSVCL